MQNRQNRGRKPKKKQQRRPPASKVEREHRALFRIVSDGRRYDVKAYAPELGEMVTRAEGISTLEVAEYPDTDNYQIELREDRGPIIEIIQGRIPLDHIAVDLDALEGGGGTYPTPATPGSDRVYEVSNDELLRLLRNPDQLESIIGGSE